MKTCTEFATDEKERLRYITDRSLPLNTVNPRPVRHLHPHECDRLDWDSGIKISIRFTPLSIIPAPVRIRREDENGFHIPAPV